MKQRLGELEERVDFAERLLARQREAVRPGPSWCPVARGRFLELQGGRMTLLAGIVVVVFSLFLVALSAVIFARPALAERFLSSFASSARAHYLEMACRLLVGTSLVVLSPAMWSTNVFRVIGWAIVISSVALLLMSWRWHHRFGKRVLPTLLRRMKVYAVGVFAFGCLLLYGVFFTGSRGAP